MKPIEKVVYPYTTSYHINTLVMYSMGALQCFALSPPNPRPLGTMTSPYWYGRVWYGMVWYGTVRFSRVGYARFFQQKVHPPFPSQMAVFNLHLPLDKEAKGVLL